MSSDIGYTINVIVDGVWMDWAEWSTCSQSCDEGERSRDRVCMMPQHGGARCDGDGKQVYMCSYSSFLHTRNKLMKTKATCTSF